MGRETPLLGKRGPFLREKGPFLREKGPFLRERYLPTMVYRVLPTTRVYVLPHHPGYTVHTTHRPAPLLYTDTAQGRVYRANPQCFITNS